MKSGATTIPACLVGLLVFGIISMERSDALAPAEGASRAIAKSAEPERFEKPKKARPKKDDPTKALERGRRLLSDEPTFDEAREGVRLLPLALDAGLEEAANDLGRCFERGIGTSADPRKGARLYRRGTKAGDVEAVLNLARLYREGIGVEANAVKAAKLYKKAALMGSAVGARERGLAFLNGAGVERDYRKAAKCFEKASDAGDALATHYLALCVEQGFGRSADDGAAVELLQKASDAGCAEASFELGERRLAGRGVEKSAEEAVELFQIALAAGIARASCPLAKSALAGFGTEKNVPEGIRLLRLGADAGVPEATRLLSDCYRRGLGVEQDQAKALRLLKKAEREGSARAALELAELFASGTGVEQNWSEAMKLAKKAARSTGDPEVNTLGNLFLGRRYANGEGVAKNEKKARALYRRVLASEPRVYYGSEDDLLQDVDDKFSPFPVEDDRAIGSALNGLGVRAFYGLGVEQNREEAANWFRAASLYGDPVASLNLAICEASGFGSEIDLEGALERLETSGATWGSATLFAPNLDASPTGVERVRKDALRFLKTGAKEENERAKKALKPFEDLASASASPSLLEARANEVYELLAAKASYFLKKI